MWAWTPTPCGNCWNRWCDETRSPRSFGGRAQRRPGDRGCHRGAQDGDRRAGHPRPLFQIGSVTKVWTATVLMRLVEQDRVGLDTLAEDVLRYRAAFGHETGTDGVLRPAVI